MQFKHIPIRLLKYFKDKPGEFLFFLFLLIASFTYQQYGISWDENIQRQTGIVNYEYAFEGDLALHNWKDKDYGAAVELPLVIVERTFDITDTRHISLMRHFLTHLLFLFSALCMYRLIVLLLKDKVLGIIGFLLLVLHPLLYSHSFFNSKDVPFMAFFIIVFYLTAKAFKDKTLKNFILLGVSTGLLIGTRVMGIMIPLMIFCLLLIDAIIERKFSRNLILFGSFLFTSFLFTYLAWPYLWEDPVNNFLTAYENMSKFRLHTSTMFNGEFVATKETPWYFFPVWFLITNPIIYLVFGGIGILIFLVFLVMKPMDFIRNTPDRNYLVFFGVLSGSVFVVIYLESVLYDQWRQLYFVYPSFVLMIIFGLSKIKKPIFRKISLGIIGLGFFFVTVHQIRQYPLQHVYFNQLIDSKSEEHIRLRWEMDYWAVSYHSALKYILDHDNTDQIRVAFDHDLVGIYHLNFLSADQRVRFQFREDPHAPDCDYFIATFRWHPADFPDFETYQLHSFKFGNNSFCRIFKLKE